MATYNVLTWRNENFLSAYPLLEDIDPQGLLVDARFVQFDGFVPILNTVLIDAENITLSITFDYGQHTGVTLRKVDYLRDDVSKKTLIYSPKDGRYLGTLIFGEGAEAVWSSAIGRKIVYNISFDPSTVRAIPSQDAVYLLDGSYGDVVLSRETTDKTIFYNSSLDLNAITFNAVGGHSVSSRTELKGLRKINLVDPINNNINLAANDVIKFTSLNAASLTVELVSGSTTKSFLIPTLTT